MNNLTKTCLKCKTTKPIECFYKDITVKDGLRRWCKTCMRNSHKRWNATHKEHNKAYRKTYWAANPERLAQVRKNYRRLHQKELRKSYAKWYAANREEQLKSRRKYYANHRAEYRRHKLKRKHAEKLNRGRSYAVWERELRSKRTFVCYWCGERKPICLLHIDHVIPVSKGGADCISNVVPSCAHCNIAKHDKDLKIWAARVQMLAI